MKKYMSPAMEIMRFDVDDTVANIIDVSNNFFNDAEFPW